MRRKGRIYVFSGPSGGGKTTLCNKLIQTTRSLVRSVSVTTRRPRRGEREGRDYFFVSRKAFQRLRRNSGLLEWTEYAHAFYGTPLAPLKEAFRKGKDIVLLLDGRGAHALKRHFKRAKTIFLLPPTLEDLKRRLAGRRTEKKSELLKRFRIAEKEIAQANRYDEIVVNDDFNRALRTLKRIVRRDHSLERR